MRGDLEEHARARVGTVLDGKYRLGRLIGSGGMATVYEAVHRNGNRVAIKMLHPHLSINGDLRARFLREGYVANKVEHRGAVRVLDDDTAEDGAVFLVMELLEGETLDARWHAADKRLPHREACEWMYQLLDVLASAHAKGVVHRDIKPENLFVTTEGVLKVLDFGIARLREANAPEGTTRTGRMIGTPAFMPPEQTLGWSREIDGQTDVWAVGATMFTLVSGQFVHQAETMEAMLVYSGSRPARSVFSVVPDLPRAVGMVIDRALAFEKPQRWLDARAMEAALEGAYAEAYGARIPGARGSRPPPTDLRAFEATVLAPAPTAADPPSVGSGPPRIGKGTEISQWPSAPPMPKGISTTAGLAQGASAPPGAARVRPARSRRIGLVVGIGAAVVMAVGGVLALSQGRPAPAAAAALTSPEPTLPSNAPEPTNPVPAVALVPPPPPQPIPPSSATAESSPSPASPAKKRVAQGAPPSAMPVAQPVAMVAKPPALAAPAAPPPKVDCDPAYVIDALGHRRYKPECLNN